MDSSELDRVIVVLDAGGGVLELHPRVIPEPDERIGTGSGRER